MAGGVRLGQYLSCLVNEDVCEEARLEISKPQFAHIVQRRHDYLVLVELMDRRVHYTVTSHIQPCTITQSHNTPLTQSHNSQYCGMCSTAHAYCTPLRECERCIDSLLHIQLV